VSLATDRTVERCCAIQFHGIGGIRCPSIWIYLLLQGDSSKQKMLKKAPWMSVAIKSFNTFVSVVSMTYIILGAKKLCIEQVLPNISGDACQCQWEEWVMSVYWRVIQHCCSCGIPGKHPPLLLKLSINQILLEIMLDLYPKFSIDSCI